MEYNGNPESVGYKIKYSRADGHGKTLSHVVQDRVEREYTIEDLEEWTEYRVQVQAFNAIGSGPWSQTVMGRTRESGTAAFVPAPQIPTACGGDPPTSVSLPSWRSKGTKAGAVVQNRPRLTFLFVLNIPAECPTLLPCPPASSLCSQNWGAGESPPLQISQAVFPCKLPMCQCPRL